MVEQAGPYLNLTTLVTDTEVRLAFHSEQIVRINLDFPLTTVNLAAFVLNCLTVLTVNAVVLVWLKLKENTLVDRMVLLDCTVLYCTVLHCTVGAAGLPRQHLHHRRHVPRLPHPGVGQQPPLHPHLLLQMLRPRP